MSRQSTFYFLGFLSFQTVLDRRTVNRLTEETWDKEIFTTQPSLVHNFLNLDSISFYIFTKLLNIFESIEKRFVFEFWLLYYIYL